MKNWSKRITNWLIDKEIISCEENELYEYAILSLFGLAFPIVIASVVGIITGLIMESIFLILPFILIRKFAGGYHAQKLKSCILASSILILIAVIVTNYIERNIWINIVTVIASISLIFLSPVDSENRRLNLEEKRMCKYTVIGITLIFVLVFEWMWFGNYAEQSKYVSMGIILASFFQLPVVIRRNIKTKYEVIKYQKE